MCVWRTIALKLQDQKMSKRYFKILEGEFSRSNDLSEEAETGVGSGQHLITSQAW